MRDTSAWLYLSLNYFHVPNNILSRFPRAAHSFVVQQKAAHQGRKTIDWTKDNRSLLECTTHFIYFYGMFGRPFVCVFGLHNDLRWPVDDQVSDFLLPRRVWCQFTDHGRIEGLVGLTINVKSGAHDRSRLHRLRYYASLTTKPNKWSYERRKHWAKRG